MDELSYDKFHENYKNIYRVLIEYKDINGNLIKSVGTPGKLCFEIKDKIPEIIEATRWSKDQRSALKRENISFYENGIASCDTTFLNIFSFNLIAGNPHKPLPDINSVIISKRLASKFFGDESPIGQTITWNNWITYSITGVFENVPSNSHMQFDILRTFEREKMAWPGGFSWDFFNRYTYLEVVENADIELIENKITTILKENSQYAKEIDAKCILQPLSKIHFEAGIMGEYSKVFDNKYIYIFISIAVFILLIITINYSNLFIAIAVKRGKEFGLRKLFGVNRISIAFQLFCETLIIILIATLLSLFLINILHSFFSTTIICLENKFNYFNFKHIFQLLLFLIAISVLISINPIIYYTTLNPAFIIKQDLFSSSNQNWNFRKILLIIQFSISGILIISVLTINKQLKHMLDKDLGYERENIIVIPIKGEVSKKYEFFKNELLNIPYITNVAIQAFIPFSDDFMPTQNIDWNGKDPNHNVEVELLGIDYDYINTLGLNLLDGRNFSKSYGADLQESIIINDELRKLLPDSSVIGMPINVKDLERTGKIIGVIKNAHFKSLHKKIYPQVFWLIPYSDLHYDFYNLFGNILVKTRVTENMDILSTIERAWKKVNPDYPFDYKILDQEYKKLYYNEKNISNTILFFTFIAVLLVCTGLYGFSAFIIESQRKSIGIRKILCSTKLNLVLYLSREYIFCVILANILSCLIGYFIIKNWLDNFAYRINIQISYFLFSILITFCVSIISILAKVLKITNANPIEAIKYE